MRSPPWLRNPVSQPWAVLLNFKSFYRTDSFVLLVVKIISRPIPPLLSREIQFQIAKKTFKIWNLIWRPNPPLIGFQIYFRNRLDPLSNREISYRSHVSFMRPVGESTGRESRLCNTKRSPAVACLIYATVGRFYRPHVWIARPLKLISHFKNGDN